MAGVRAPKGGPKSVPSQSRPSFVLGSRPSTLYAPKSQPRLNADISKPPRITQNSPSQRQYGKTPSPFGNTGAY